jgi:integrase
MPLALYRRKAIWNYRGTIGPSGKRRRLSGSCQTADKDIAARQVAEIEAKYWSGHFDGPEAILTFAQAAKLYRAAGRSDRFLDKVEAYLGQTLVKDISEGAIQLMAKELYPTAVGASLNRMAVAPAQAVINHAAKSKLCSRISVERYKVDGKIKDPATWAWIEAFVKHAAPHVGALAMFMYLTGARIGEALDVKWDDLDLAAGTVLIRESKQSKERVSNLPGPLVAALASLSHVPGRGVFGYEASTALRNAWEGAIRKARIKRLTPHSCRHGFATGLLRAGVDVVTVAWLGGWKDTTQVLKSYGHANKNPKLNDLLVGGSTKHNYYATELLTPDQAPVEEILARTIA